jgi:hypothetical protein
MTRQEIKHALSLMLQIATPFSALTEAEKNSDHDQVKRYLHTITEGFVTHAKHSGSRRTET